MNNISAPPRRHPSKNCVAIFAEDPGPNRMQRSCTHCLNQGNAAALHTIKNWILRNFSSKNSKDDAKDGYTKIMQQ